MTRIVVLGSNGMAGHLILEFLKKNKSYELIGFDEKLFTLGNYSFVKKLDKINPDIIINTLRITIKESEDNPRNALFINSVIPKWFEKTYYNTNTKIIHLSTDCVFSGNKGNYNETDPPDGSSIYSMTKFCGEIINEKDLTIRTSFIGPNLKGKNEELFDWFLLQNGEIEGYKNAFWNGVTTLELAKQINVAITINICGLYHLCSKIKISKYELLSLINKQWCNNTIKIKESFKIKIDRNLIDNRKELNVLEYSRMFNELYNFMQRKKKSYCHYYNKN